jgi:DNA-binding CsgD family transcriptional regulator
MAEGYTTKEIADKLKYSFDTIEFYRMKIIKKAGVKNSCQLISWAYKNRILQLTPTL